MSRGAKERRRRNGGALEDENRTMQRLQSVTLYYQENGQNRLLSLTLYCTKSGYKFANLSPAHDGKYVQ